MGQRMPVPVLPVSYDAVQAPVSAPRLLISTLATDSACFIRGTVPPAQEADRVNALLADARQRGTAILIVYGRHAADESVDAKCAQLALLGCARVFKYAGGMFEWLLLREAYGAELFPVEGVGVRPPDPLDFTPASPPAFRALLLAETCPPSLPMLLRAGTP